MLRIEKINALSELDRYGWRYEPSSTNEVRCLCPCHDDQTPSASLNVEKNLWRCHVCKAAGDIVSLLAHIGKCERKTIIVDLLSRYPDLETIKVINQERVEEYHKAIWNSGPFLKQLYDRGITDEDIKAARLGYFQGRIMIPIYDMEGRVVNIRKYLPGAPGPEKMKNVRGYTTMALYPIKQIIYPTIWICGGEMKALVAARKLNPHQVGAITVTAGEGNWDHSFNDLIKDKYIFICMDVDQAGLAARRIIANVIHKIVKAIYFIDLPLDVIKYPKGDLNDWVGGEGATSEDFLTLMKVALKFVAPSIKETEEIINCKLIEAARAEQIGKRIHCNAIISALDTVPFIVPSIIGVKCTRDQPFCDGCKVNVLKIDEQRGLTFVTVEPSNVGILEMVNVAQKNLRFALLTAIGAPGCKIAEFYPQKFYNVLDSRLTSPLELDGDNREHIVQPAYIVSDQHLDLNTPYKMQGRTFPNPLTSQAVLLVDNIEEIEDSLASCRFSSQDLERLKIFQPTDWTLESLTKKLEDIYTDLAFNVTRIFHRQDLHLAFDLAYHSVLHFLLEGRAQHGWVNCLITGDSSQGKSEVAIRLIEHYGLGTRHDCKNASEAGLLGGLQQIGTRWFVAWGVIPIHDKQLVIMEEIKGADPRVLGKLTDMRSSGRAQITKIERRSAFARTRLIMISNPRSDKPVSSYTYGVEIIKELIGSLEDIRRFDYAIILSEKEIQAAEINKLTTSHKVQDPYYSSEICRKAVLWAWTRSLEGIEISEETAKLCLSLSQKLCKDFSETVPLCDKGTMRYKLMRLAISLACRTFSTEETTVIVRPCHVQYVCDFLYRIYMSPYCGYKDFSVALEYTSTIKDDILITKQIKATKYPKDLVEQLLHSESIMLADICDWCEVPRDSGQKIMSLFVRKRALFREGMQYTKSSGFITLLKKMLIEKLEQQIDEKEEF